MTAGAESVTVVVALDDEPTVEQLEPVLGLARLGGWRIDLVHVVSPPPLDATTERDLDHSQAPVLSDIAHTLRADGFDVFAHRVSGPIIETLLNTATELEAGLVVILARTHERQGRTLLGSTTSALLKASDVPVLVLPQEASADDRGYRSSLVRLVDRVEREDAEAANAVREAAAARLSEGGDEERSRRLDERLRDALHRFETDHPTLTRAINDVSYYLSGMGI